MKYDDEGGFDLGQSLIIIAIILTMLLIIAIAASSTGNVLGL